MGHDSTMPTMSSPRHISTNEVSGMNASSISGPSPPSGMHTSALDSVVPNAMQAGLVTAVDRGGQRTIAHIGSLSPGTADGLYSGSQRLFQPDDLQQSGSGVTDRVNVGAGGEHATSVLANAVVETLFTGSCRKKEGPVPTPGEFRAALQDFKESIKAKANRQRNEARAETARLQEAISVLVGSRTSFASKEEPFNNGLPPRTTDADSDESGDDFAGANPVNSVNASRRDWNHSYDRK